MNEVIPFTYEDTNVRTVATEDGTPWFVAKDVCNILGLSNPRTSLALLDEDEKGVHSMDTLGGKQELTTVNEAGLYALILKSRKPEARKFKRWVTHEVLPSIRKRGGYLTPEATEKALTDPDFIIQLATSLKEERAKRAALEAENEANKPKVLFADSVATSHTSILVGEFAKILKGNGVEIGQQRLFKWLRDNKYLIKRQGSDWNMPTQHSMELGLFEIKETTVNHSDGHIHINKTPKVTGKGQIYFANKFLNKQIADGGVPKKAAS